MPPITGFEQDCQTSVGALRAALLEIYAAVGGISDSPQDVSRAFNLNKNLTWKLARIIAASTAEEALQHLPGPAGMQIFLKAMAKAGAEHALVERVRSAYDEVEQVVQVHVGDRSTLELVLDGRNPNRAERLEVSRKIAFRGNSGVWGVQARAKVTLAAMAPNRTDPAQLDMAFVRGYIGFRRLRSELSWPISIRRDWTGEGEPFVGEWEPIEPEEAERGLPVMRRFTSATAPKFELRAAPEGVYYMLPPGPVGNAGAFDCFFGDIARAQSARYRSETERFGEIVSSITLPVEHQLLDLIFHQDLAEEVKPEVVVFGDPFGTQAPIAAKSHCRLPIEERAHPMPGSPPIAATPLYPRYPEIVARIYERMGWSPAEFRGVRLHMRYPPMGTNVSLRFELPERP